MALLAAFGGAAQAAEPSSVRPPDLVRVPEPLPEGSALVAPEEPLPAPPVMPLEPLPVRLELLRSAEQAEVVETVNRWITAWWQQEVDAYLGFYAEDFQVPEELDREAWERLRRERLIAPSFISLRIEAPQVMPVGEQTYRAKFLQHYRSDSYQDTVVKILDLTREDGQWKILREESSEPLSPSAQARL